MKAIRHFQRLERTLIHRIGKGCVMVMTDHLHRGMPRQPIRDRLGLAVGQQIQHPMRLYTNRTANLQQ
jgi:hypothetical protein